MATTTNYGWDTPDDTDLVKDGAAAIRTLGSSVDTTTKNLNPQTTTGALAYRSATANINTALPIGTAGQILAVSGGVPAWINNDQGDITEVQAGTGISVASGTGPIPVVTNTVATAIDAKGDLIVGTGADAFSRLAVGATNGMVLTVDSAEATGLKYATPTTTAFVGCSVYTTANVNIANSTATKVAWNAEYYDTDSMHDNSTNNTRITIPSGQGGKYLITTQILFENNATGERNVRITKNNTDWGYLNITGVNSGSSYYCISGTEVLDLAAADYIEIKVSQNSGGNLALIENSRLQVSKIG